jgi:hypothetical protein
LLPASKMVSCPLLSSADIRSLEHEIEAAALTSLVEALQSLVCSDRSNLRRLLRQLEWCKWHRSPYSYDVLNLILERHTDRVLDELIRCILSLESSEDRAEWVKRKGKEGVDLVGWQTKEAERLNQYWRTGVMREPLPEEANILSLFIDHRKTESGYFMLFKN